MLISRPISRAFRHMSKGNGKFSSSSTPKSSPRIRKSSPRHFLSIADLTSAELVNLVRNAHVLKQSMKIDSVPQSILGTLWGKSVALMFSKRSTRTRISTEGAVAVMGGHPMFLGKEDIQLGVNESLHDTSVVISSMVAAIVARVGPHSDIRQLAIDSSVPVINALSDLHHPMQTIADFLTVYEFFGSHSEPEKSVKSDLGLKGLKIAWVGDANNVLYDLAIGATKLGVNLAVATPKDITIPDQIRKIIQETGNGGTSAGTFSEFHEPEKAVKGADIVVTDTWVSMGQEAERKRRLTLFKGFQVTTELMQRGGANPEWKFMHCLPRHPEEVSDEVFYSPRSLVFPEAENRLYAAIATLHSFVVNRGQIKRIRPQQGILEQSQDFEEE